MLLETLTIQNLRKIEESHLSLSPNINLITGENAQGKTTILEGVSILATGRSFRTSRDRDLIRRGMKSTEHEPFAAVETRFLKSDTRRKIRVAITTKSKSVYIDNKPISRLGELWGEINVVTFVPSDLELVQGGPPSRRSLVSSLLVRSSRHYLNTMQNFERSLKHRNRLIKERVRSSSPEFQAFEEQMASYGSELMIARTHLIKRFSEKASKHVMILAGGRDEFIISHEAGFSKASGFNPEWLDERKKETVSKWMKNYWTNQRRSDLDRGYTESGPQRMDMKLILNKTDARQFSSQGQARTIVLGLRLAELDLLKEVCHASPILLLDDVLGELDQRRTQHFMKILSRDNTQALLTATDAHQVEQELPIGGRFLVMDGSIKPVGRS